MTPDSQSSNNAFNASGTISSTLNRSRARSALRRTTGRSFRRNVRMASASLGPPVSLSPTRAKPNRAPDVRFSVGDDVVVVGHPEDAHSGTRQHREPVSDRMHLSDNALQLACTVPRVKVCCVELPPCLALRLIVVKDRSVLLADDEGEQEAWEPI